MMTRIRETARRSGRRKLLVAGAIALISAVLLWEHSAPGGHQMPDHEGAVGAVGICLAVLQVGGVLLLGVGLISALRRARPSHASAPRPRAPFLIPKRGPTARARPDPATLQVFLR